MSTALDRVLTIPNPSLEADWLDRHTPSRLLPELELMLAVLEDGLSTAKDSANKHNRMEARQWIESRAHDGLFSFENICEVLGIDAGGIRKRAMAKWAG